MRRHCTVREVHDGRHCLLTVERAELNVGGAGEDRANQSPRAIGRRELKFARMVRCVRRIHLGDAKPGEQCIRRTRKARVVRTAKSSVVVLLLRQLPRRGRLVADVLSLAGFARKTGPTSRSARWARRNRIASAAGYERRKKERFDLDPPTTRHARDTIPAVLRRVKAWRTSALDISFALHANRTSTRS